jgi:predicted CopG family antitoxin
VLQIKDLVGSCVVIEGEDIKRKKEACRMIFEILNGNKSEEELKKEPNEDILILVPNGLVSIIIGSRGKNIKNLIDSSKANIVVNQPVYKMLHRTISISGK